MASAFSEYLKRMNTGVLIEEKDYSVYNITSNYQRAVLVVGSSVEGPPNLPVMVDSPERFEDIFGKQDYRLEKKGSYFHRTVKEMLKVSPVICINIRPSDENETMSWQSLSSSCLYPNAERRTTEASRFYDRLDGFWRRSTEAINTLSDTAVADSSNLPISFLNMGKSAVSIIVVKSDISGFDITAEDWWGYGAYPDYLHPKDIVSDYILDIIAVKGEWNDYGSLSSDSVWGQYFTENGLKKSRSDEFFKRSDIKTIKKWQASIIPYFTDKQGKDMFIESVINRDINETDIMCAVKADEIEDFYRTGKIDITGDSLTKINRPSINFLSYKEYLTDFQVISEEGLDTEGNAFGNHLYSNSGRTMLYAEGYIHGVKMKELIISTTTSIEVRPLSTSSESYGIINGKRVDLSGEVIDYIALHERVSANKQAVYAVILTESGIEFRWGSQTPKEQEPYLPALDYKTEIALGYYAISQDDMLNYDTVFYPAAVDTQGFVNPFGDGITVSQGYDSTVQYLSFKDTVNVNTQDYSNIRIQHLWWFFSTRLQEGTSLAVGSDSAKNRIKWVQGQQEDNDRIIKITVEEGDIDGSTTGVIAYYMEDREFIDKSNIWEQSRYPISFSATGIIGDDSVITEAYYNGQINSGDPFFRGITESYGAEFIYDQVSGQNLIVMNDITDPSIYEDTKMVLYGTLYNDGIKTMLGTINYNNRTAVVVQEEVYPETADIMLFDAVYPIIINLYSLEGKTTAVVEDWDGDPQELYNQVYGKKDSTQWAKSVDIIRMETASEAVVEYDRYVDSIEVGYSLLADPRITEHETEMTKNWTRIIEVRRLSDTELLVTADRPIFVREGVNLQTDMFIPIHEWVEEWDFKVLSGKTMSRNNIPDGTEERLQHILGTISKGSRLATALSSANLRWRYVVDSWGLGMYEESKKEIHGLAELKGQAFAFVNTPSLKALRKSGTKYTTNGSFDMQKFASGGDRKREYGDFFSLYPSGHGAYIFPYLASQERGRWFLVPPAAYAAQAYMRKHNSKTMKPWDTAAGVEGGKLISYGVEDIFSDDDITALDMMGITAISKNGGTTYLANETTSYNEFSAFKSIKVRESVIELEISLKKALNSFVWDSNDEDTLLTITEDADTVCEYYRSVGAIYSYENKIDQNAELADNQIAVLDTYIEPVKGIKLLVSKFNIMKTGTLS